MQKIIGDKVKTLTRVSADTAVPLFEPEHTPAVADSSIDDLLEGVDAIVSGMKKKTKNEKTEAPALDRDSLFNEINEAAHQYDCNDSNSRSTTKQPEVVQVRTLNIF